jgi:hypothetical protein
MRWRGVSSCIHESRRADPTVDTGRLDGTAIQAPLFEFACVLVRLDHVTSFMVNASHGVMCGSESFSASNEVNDQDDGGNYEQHVDQAAANVADEAKKPENNQNDNYSPEHRYIPFG